ncbi:YgcG family protein [Duganella sp. Root1480D1]|uniref:TPM domain-containing protein n=1 Tax=Duganella sp. Root1480D1 TaxID=1736471 RepID=UPI0009EBAC30|nr:TPM domain-containing protein [Duganella sp. Root1480D1]
MATTPRQTRGGGKASRRDEDRLSDPLIDRDLARRTGGLPEHAQRWRILPGSPWLRVVIGLAILALLALVVTGARAADGFVAVPAQAARVTDQAGMLNAQQRTALDATLADYERRTGSQVAILLLPSTAPEAIEQYSLRVAEAWKLGRKGIDDGVLLVVAKDNPSSLRRLRIEAGRGVQGSLTDAQSKRILQDVIAPRFRQGDFYGGLAAGVSAITALMDKEHFPAPAGAAPAASATAAGSPASGGVAGMADAAGAGAIASTGPARDTGDTARGTPAGAGHADSGWSGSWLLPALLFGAFVILPILRGGSRRGLRRGGWGSDATGVLLGAALGNALSAAAHRGSAGSSWGGGGFGGGDSGGGFSGGGGTFDGGGASGDW